MKKVKSVAFNVADAYELALYTHAEKYKYFSTYIKRLIARDMEHGDAPDLKDFFEAAQHYDSKKTEEDN